MISKRKKSGFLIYCNFKTFYYFIIHFYELKDAFIRLNLQGLKYADENINEFCYRIIEHQKLTNKLTIPKDGLENFFQVISDFLHAMF